MFVEGPGAGDPGPAAAPRHLSEQPVPPAEHDERTHTGGRHGRCSSVGFTCYLVQHIFNVQQTKISAATGSVADPDLLDLYQKKGWIRMQQKPIKKRE